MVSQEFRDRIHSLIEKATDTQLDAVLQVLESSSIDNKYTKEDIDSFYERVKLFEDGGRNGHSVNESHALIREKRKPNGA